MKRSTAFALVVTTTLLVLAGQLPRLPWDAIGRAWRAALAASRLPRPAFALPAWRPPVTAYGLREAALLAAAIVVIGLLVAIATRLLAKDPRRRVYQLAREGRPTAGIARAARVPQDAVRTLLTPGLGSPRPR